jgi:hypothetical protein
MKKKAVFIAFCVITVISCTIEKTITPTSVIIKTTEEILTGKTWKADEIRVQLSNNTTQYYKRGISGTLYHSDSIKFNANNTGTYYYSGSAYASTWNFTNSRKTKMTVVINQSPTPITIYLENIQLAETYFKYAQYFIGAVSYLASCTRVPD